VSFFLSHPVAFFLFLIFGSAAFLLLCFASCLSSFISYSFLSFVAFIFFSFAVLFFRFSHLLFLFCRRSKRGWASLEIWAAAWVAAWGERQCLIQGAATEWLCGSFMAGQRSGGAGTGLCTGQIWSFFIFCSALFLFADFGDALAFMIEHGLGDLRNSWQRCCFLFLHHSSFFFHFHSARSFYFFFPCCNFSFSFFSSRQPVAALLFLFFCFSSFGRFVSSSFHHLCCSS
jgi:hypothetical protein